MNTAPVPPAFWGVDDNRRDANERRAQAAGLEPCVVCGRGVRNGWEVVVSGGGTDLIAWDDYEADPAAYVDDPGFMGCWTIGPECGKGIGKEYRRRP